MAVSSILVKSFQISALAASIALVGCGGGGNNDTIQPAIDSSYGGSTNTGGTSTNAALKISAITLLDVNGKPTNSINGNGAKASVTVTDAAGKPVSGAIVTFSSSAPVKFGTTNASVLTNAKGEASISVQPEGNLDNGAYTLSATVEHEGVTATTGNYNFTLQSANIGFSNLTASNTSLASGGSTNITLTTLDTTTNLAANDVAVNFTTSCGTFDNASVTSSNQGNITTTYKAIDANGKLCTGEQTITATTANGGTTQTLKLNIQAIQASSIVYTTANAITLGSSNSGSTSTGQVEFTVYSNGVPAANQQVKVSKNYAPSDFSFGTLGNQSEQTFTSDSNGKVTVTVYPGALPGPVELKAVLASNSSVVALTKDVSVATGRATQNGLSLSLSKNTLAKGVDGDTATVTVRLVDRVGNAVPNGTVVSFVAEGGKITPNCSTVDGVCSATFTTQNPRPVDDRISVVAYVEGDKSYTDSNGNNKFDLGESLTQNIGSLFRDDNENNQHDLGEFVYIRPISGSAAACGTSTFTQPNLITQVLSSNPLSTTTHQCDNQLSAVLRSQFVLGLAENTPTFVPPFTTLSAGSGQYSFKMYGNSAQTVSMPAGTTISVAAKSDATYTPTVRIENGNFIVENAKPNSQVTITIGNQTLSGVTDSNGRLVTPNTTGNTTDNPTVTPANSAACSAELVSGNMTVPALVDLSNGRVADRDVSYTLEYKNCSAGDEVRVTTVSPAPDATTVTKIVKFR